MKKLILLLAFIFLFSGAAEAKRLHQEKTYQAVWCKANNGRTEVVLNDKVRVDCLTKTHAIEFDFANKWAESVGQSLYYGLQTKKKPGVVLILENPRREARYLRRLKRVAKRKGIDVWVMYEADLKLKQQAR